MNNFFEDLSKCTFENMVNTVKVAQQAKDNLFSANHRNQMMRSYGYTEAMRVKIEDLI